MKPLSPKQAKAEARRAYLVEQATRCLAEKGYAHVSLRDIAQESGVSLGILHYYFRNKEDLLLAVITGYKNQFLRELEEELLSGPFDGRQTRLSAIVYRALTEDRNIHRLWYDLQIQAMYTPAFRPPVQNIRDRLHALIESMLDRICHEYAAGVETRIIKSWVPLFYTAIDGLFLQALTLETQEAREAVSRLEEDLSRLLSALFAAHSHQEEVEKWEL